MLEVFIEILISISMSVYGFLVIKKISENNTKLLALKNIALILLLTLISFILHNTEYNSVYTICIFIINIIIYKYIFRISIEESLISCGIMLFLTFISELVFSLISIKILSAQIIRENIIIYLGTNLIILIIGLTIIKNKLLLRQIQKFYKSVSHNRSVSNFLFLILLIISLSTLAQNIALAAKINMEYIATITIMLGFFILSLLFIESKNKYNDLTSNYDSLFNYVQNFEEWIEKEQLNHHEYKNQLAVLRCLTKEKTVKNKIDEILEDDINIEGQIINQLKQLPKGGIKGLMYYKTAIAQKNRIRLTVDISLENKTLLSKISEQEIRTLCKLIGIYFDNAIEAAKETKKKDVLIEIYEISNKVTFVFSNTFKKHKNFDDRNKKGVSSKGNGHGNGLYFASKLISSSDNLESKQDIVENYYIQQLIIHKKKTSKN